MAGDPMSVGAEQTGELYATRILTQPIFNRIQLAVRRVGSDDETFLGDSGIYPRQNISRRLPIDDGREQQNAGRKRDGSPTEGRGAGKIRKFHEEQTQRLGLWIIAEQFAAAACVATTHGGALLSPFRAMDLGPPLNSVLESKLNHDLLQQGCCQAGEASGCLVE